MEKELVATALVSINAPIDEVWNALIDPKLIRQYMFGTDVISDWKIGSPISWKGFWEGKSYEDKGEVLRKEPGKMLQYSHFSPIAGKPDIPENYHVLTYELSVEEDEVLVKLSQDNNKNEEELKHSQGMWQKMLDELKQVLEKN